MRHTPQGRVACPPRVYPLRCALGAMQRARVASSVAPRAEQDRASVLPLYTALACTLGGAVWRRGNRAQAARHGACVSISSASPPSPRKEQAAVARAGSAMAPPRWRIGTDAWGRPSRTGPGCFWNVQSVPNIIRTPENSISTNYCCLPNFGRCGQSQEGVWVNCPLVNRLYPAEWMAKTLFHTVDHPS